MTVKSEPFGMTTDPVDEFISLGEDWTPPPPEDARHPRRRAWSVPVAVIAALALGVVGGRLTAASDARDSAAPQTLSVETSTTSSDSGSLADIISTAMDSIVSVRTVSEAGAFGAPFAREVQGEGSGVVIRADGIILTNAHVVEGATQIEVAAADGDGSFEAMVLGSDAEHDLAILKVDAENLTPITIGSSAKLDLGDSVVALGYPLGLGPTATEGIVSGLDRTVQVGDGPFDAKELRGLLQTDAAINPGNSGGALINANGHLIGINTAAASASSAENIGFAVAIDEALPVIESFLE